MARKNNPRALRQARDDAAKKQARLDVNAAAAIDAQDAEHTQHTHTQHTHDEDAMDDDELYGDFEDVEGKEETTTAAVKRTATDVLDAAVKASKKQKREDPLYRYETHACMHACTSMLTRRMHACMVRALCTCMVHVCVVLA